MSGEGILTLVVLAVAGCLFLHSSYKAKASASPEDKALATLCQRFQLTAKKTRDLADKRFMREMEAFARGDDKLAISHLERNVAIRDTLNAVESMVCVTSPPR
jgi:hypothetical protein